MPLHDFPVAVSRPPLSLQHDTLTEQRETAVRSTFTAEEIDAAIARRSLNPVPFVDDDEGIDALQPTARDIVAMLIVTMVAVVLCFAVAS